MGRVLVTRTLDRLRSERRRKRRERSSAKAEAHDDTPDECLLSAEKADWLAQRIAELPARDRTLAATAEALGLTRFAVHGRLRRILHSLREKARRAFHDD